MPIVARRSAWYQLVWGLALVVAGTAGSPGHAEDAGFSLRGEVPTSISDLRSMQDRIQSLTEKVLASTVGVRVGAAHGSGVIISPDGYVLTAAHVAGQPKRRATLILQDGRRVQGITLGVYRTVDAGLIQITSPANEANENESWLHVPFGDSSKLAPGQWCVATGHPGGYQSGRPPVVRVGRILSVSDDAINTDCTLIGGDSGGPLFDLNGNVIGVHSRIGSPLTVNLHVPVLAYRDAWDRLVDGQAWGHLPGSEPYIGVQGESDTTQAKIVRVFSNSPAELAGIEVGDIVVRFADRPVTNFDALKQLVAEQEPGTEVPVEVMRGQTRVRLTLEIGDRRG